MTESAVDGPDRPRPTTEFLGRHDLPALSVLMTRVAAVFLLVGGVGGIGSHLVDAGGGEKLVISAMAGLGGIVLSVLAANGRSLGLAAAHPTIVAAALLIGMAASTEEGRGMILLVGIGVFAAVFTSTAQTFGYLAFIAVVIALAESYERGFDAAKVGHLVLAIAITSLVVHWLVDRLSEVAFLERDARVAGERLSQRRADYLARMSHELRTPLNAVIGFSEVLGARTFGALDDKQAEYVGHIETSGRHLLGLINDVLDTAQVERGQLDLDATRFALVETLDQAVKMLGETASSAGVELSLDCDPAVGEIEGDRRKIHQVVLNLVANAVRFTPAGGSITVAARQLDDSMVELRVIDTGVGIAPEDMDRVFAEFTQGSGPTHGGTGLGLALARRLVELHGGEMWVESEVGAGSTFVFTLPTRSHGVASLSSEVETVIDVGSLDTVANRRRFTTIGSIFLGSGGLIGLLTAVSEPSAALVVTSALGVVAGIVLGWLLLAARPLPVRWVNVLVPLGTVLIAVGNATSNDGRGMPLFICGVVGAAIFADRRWATVHTAMACIAVGVTDSVGRGFDPVQFLTMSFIFATGGVVVHRLVTSLRAVADREREARQELEALTRHRSAFLARMSHELRTPLNAVIGFADVLGMETMGDLNGKQREYVDHIGTSGRHLLALINDVLELSKAEAGRLDAHVTEVPFPAVLHTAVAAGAGELGGSVAVTCDPAIDVVEVDEEQVHRAIRNVVACAVQRDATSVEVAASRSDGGAMIEVLITDRGAPISPDDAVGCFEEFSSLGATGLELALSRHLVELNGGSIDVRSGDETVWRLTVPVEAVGSDRRSLGAGQP